MPRILYHFGGGKPKRNLTLLLIELYYSQISVHRKTVHNHYSVSKPSANYNRENELSIVRSRSRQTCFPVHNCIIKGFP